MKRKQSFKYSKFENKKSNIQVFTKLSTDGVGAKKKSPFVNKLFPPKFPECEKKYSFK